MELDDVNTIAPELLKGFNQNSHKYFPQSGHKLISFKLHGFKGTFLAVAYRSAPITVLYRFITVAYNFKIFQFQNNEKRAETE